MKCSIDDILTELNSSVKTDRNYFTFDSAQNAAEFLESLKIDAGKAVTPEILSQITSAQNALSKRRSHSSRADLVTKLFADVLGFKKETFERLALLDKNDRGYAEGLISVWNEELDRTLNLSYCWQHDDRFALRINFKDGVFYFEITDKTGSVYTFRERSSGLRFFLSYYIQAKALEHKYREQGCTILMDEPDSFLSIAAQKNLLSVFESLVTASASTHKLQLIYTTHSPFLINQNYPNRIRLVRKGDAEEGTQFIDESRLRHYEPVRSALGIDCAQTLFMGETNVVLEGPSDQFLITELNRQFVMKGDPASFLDLTSLVIMSAESAPGVQKLLAASNWGDERKPATVVLFDGDREGIEQSKRVTGRSGKEGEKQLIEPDFVMTITEALGDKWGSQAIVTTEDLIPSSLYATAVHEFLKKWYADVLADSQKAAAINKALSDSAYGTSGLVEATEVIFKEHVHPERDKYDKMGVFHEVVTIVADRITRSTSDGQIDESVSELERRLKKLCEELWRRIDLCRGASQRVSTAQAVRREIGDFFKRFKESAPAFDIVRIIERLYQEVKQINEDGDKLRAVLTKLQHEIQQFRDRGETAVKGEYWMRWSTALWRVKENPLQPDITEFNDLLIDQSVFSKATSGDLVEDGDASVATVGVQGARTKRSSRDKQTKEG